MPIPTSKSELLDAIAQRFAKLDVALEAVPIARALDKTMDGHAKDTMMSPNNLVSYLIGWNSLVLKWLELDQAGKTIQFPERGYQWNQLGALAQKFYDDHAGLGFEDNRFHLSALKSRIMDEVSKRSDETLYGAPWHGKWTMGRMIQLNTSSPYENARGRIRKWLKQQL
jgi:hypothetical protein